MGLINVNKGINGCSQVFAFQSDIWGKHLMLAKNLAYKYAPGNEEAEDAAVAGLFEAARRFNPASSKKNYFSSYAHKWVVKYILKAMSKPVNISIFEPLPNSNSDSNLEIKDTIQSTCNLHEEVEKRELSDKVRKMVMSLKPKQRLVIFGRYFCDKTLREMSNELHVTFERVRQIENEAIRAMRRLPIAKEIKIYAN